MTPNRRNPLKWHSPALFRLIHCKSHLPGREVFLKLRSPSRKLDKLFIGAVVIAHALIKLRNFSHFFIVERKVEDIQVVSDMIDIFASGDHSEAHLCVPAKNDLRRSLSVLFSKFCEYRFTDQRFVAVAEPVHSNSWLSRVFRLQYVEDCEIPYARPFAESHFFTLFPEPAALLPVIHNGVSHDSQTPNQRYK